MRIFASLVFVAVTGACPHQQQKVEQTDITGYFAVEGKEASGKVYSGVVTIQKAESTYFVQWTTGPTVSTGVGQRHGDTLSVGWKVEGGGPVGCTVYKISKDGKELSGTYVMVSGKGVTTALPETLTFLRRLPKPIKGDI